jgi:hypothetical protein
MRSPLREQLGAADAPTLREATQTCLTKGGWKVDPILGLTGGADVMAAVKGQSRTEVYIYGAASKSRLTGGPDYETDPFWSCLGATLKPAPKPGP